ncbi:MAG TPA: ABC transporter substrate-binding protein, partial [Deltaproteobacteria bacterium]|nr:ABC transporter substrate-binding protein [Deltaproteobacteria bacterium]
MRRDAEWVQYDPATRQVIPQGGVTAHDVVYSIRRALDPATEAVGAYADYVIKNAEAVNYGEDEDLESIGVRAVDDYTVEFTLEHPTAYFPGLLASQVNRIVPQRAIEE